MDNSNMIDVSILLSELKTANTEMSKVINTILSQSKAAQCAMSGETYGYTFEKDFRGSKIYGYARTRGYNAYKGKG